MRHKPLYLLSLLTLAALLTGCPSKTKPVKDRIAHVWTARMVEENNQTVYTKGGTNNIRPGYSNFKLDLSNPPAVKITFVDGTQSTGQYSLPSDTQLSLTGLTPVPTGTNGQIDYTFTLTGESELVLTRTSADIKTGNTTNKYTLTNP